MDMEIEIPDEPKVVDHDRCFQCDNEVEVHINANTNTFSVVNAVCFHCGWTGAAYLPRFTVTG